jgi:hypothetical protein
VRLRDLSHTEKPGAELHELMIDSSVARAMQEHELLQNELMDIYVQARKIGSEGDLKQMNRDVRQLGDSVKRFMKHWSDHAHWEDEQLFPNAASVLGTEPELFSLMEREHELAEEYIRVFMQALERAVFPIDQEEARKLTALLLQAHAVLKNRFREEEEIMLELTDRSNAYGF